MARMHHEHTMDEHRHITPELLAKVEALYDQGLYLDAFQESQKAGPLHEWRGAEGLILAGRLANNLGNPRLGHALHFQASRRHGERAHVLYWRARHMAGRRGPLAAWRFVESVGEHAEFTAGQRADWYSLCGNLQAHFRDFDAAEQWFKKALEMAPDHRWTLIERTYALQAQDLYEEALAMAQSSLASQPFYRPGVQAAAHLLTLLSRDEEALALLRAAADAIQSGDILAQLAGLQIELDDQRGAVETLRRIERFWPLADKAQRHWLKCSQIDAAYHSGDIADARARLADFKPRRKGEDFFVTLAARLNDGKAYRRKKLSVPFVRQHWVTCMPAMLARYWRQPHEHLEIAEKICYDGTPQPADRTWANEHGYVTREFTLTWESATALIDRDVPFVLCTVEPGRGHAQAIVGYDEARGTLLVRDPYLRQVHEFVADKALQRWRSTGPRAMVVLPAGEAARLEGLDLPDAASHDLLYALQVALEKHRRDEAMAALQQLQTGWPGHRITLYAERAIAHYDVNQPGILAATEALLKLFPEDANIMMTKVSLLRDHARRGERVAMLAAMSRGEQANVLFWDRYANELLPDARTHGEVAKWLRRTIRAAAGWAGGYYTLAHLYWSRQQREEAFDLYRIAMCLEDKNEAYAHSYFQVSRFFKQAEEALTLLKARFARLGGRSSLPARTLFYALESLERPREGFAVLEEAIKRRPDDADLLLMAANGYSRYGRFKDAHAKLAAAEGKAHRGALLFEAASIADLEGRLTDARDLWRQMLEIDPLCMPAHRALARLLAETESREAALTHVRGAAERFKYHCEMQELLVVMLREQSLEEVEAALRQMIENHHDNAWTYRELAIVLAMQLRFDAAQEAVARAKELAPHEIATLDTAAYVAWRAGKIDEARELCIASLKISIDNEQAMSRLLDFCNNTQERLEALTFVRKELEQQVVYGEAVTAFRQLAQAVLSPEETLNELVKARTARPDLWQTWAASADQLTAMRRHDEAITIAQQAAEKFSLLPRVWYCLAHAYLSANDEDAAMAALQTALEINPSWSVPARYLANIHERRGEFAQAAEVLQSARARSPLDTYTLEFLGTIYWKMQRHDEAIAVLTRAVQITPTQESAWLFLRRIGEELGRPNLMLDLARENVARRAGDVSSYLILARAIDTNVPGGLEEILRTLQKATALDPYHIEAMDLYASCLAFARRFDQAALVCRPSVFARQPASLRAREIWVTAQRGAVRQAIEDMEKFVAEEQTLLWAWQRLAGWYADSNLLEKYVATARRMAELFPQDTSALEYLAHALLRNDQKDEAQTTLKRVLKINPDSEFAAFTLFDLYLEAQAMDDAQAIVEHMASHHFSPHEITARKAKLALQQNDAQVPALVETWAQTKGMSPDEFAARLADLVEQKPVLMPAIVEKLKAVVKSGEFNEAAPAGLMKLLASREGEHRCSEVLQAIAGNEAAWRTAMRTYVEEVARAKQKARLNSLIAKHANELRPHDDLWGCAVRTLVELDLYQPATRFAHDWAVRKNVRTGSLLDLAIAYLMQRRFAEARDVSKAALGLADDEYREFHELWLCSDALIRRAPTREELTYWTDRLKRMDRRILREYYQYLYDVCVEATALWEDKLGGQAFTVAAARKTLKALAKHRQSNADPLLRGLAQRHYWRMVRHVKRPMAALYAMHAMITQ